MRKSTLLLGTILGVGLATPAIAQDAAVTQTTDATAADPASEEAPAEIVVTAQKRSERLQEVPVAVSVLSGAALDAMSRPSIEGASQLVPALNYQKSGTTLNQSIFMRGVGTATFSIAGEPSVSTVVDGVVYARSGEAFSELVDVDRLEVLRGPQGTLFGKNASAGVINIVTRMPEMGVTGGSAEIGWFSKNEYRLKTSLNVPLGTNVAGRLTAFYGDYDGFINNRTTGGRVNGYEHYGVRGQLLWEPSSTVRLYATADYHKNDDDCCAQILATGPLTGAGAPTTSLAFSVLPAPAGADTREIAQNLVTSTIERGWGTSLQADVDVGNHTLTSITAYREFDNTEIRDGDWLPAAYVGFGQLHDRGPQTSDTFTQELRIASPARQFLSYVLGAYYSNAYSRRVFTRQGIVCNAAAGAPTGVLIPCGSTFAAPSRTPNGTADFGSRFKNFALFGQATANITDAIRLIGGLRYSNDKLGVFHKRVSNGLDISTTTGLPVSTGGTNPNFDQGVYNRYLELLAAGQSPNNAAANAVGATNGIPFRTSTKEQNLSGKGVIQVDITPNVMAYGSYTRGYKGPAYNILYGTTGTTTNALSAETSDSWELGLKNTLLNGRMTLNIAAFRADYHNFQANNPDLVGGVVVARFTNAGEVSTRGVEADLSWRPVRDLSINGGLAYTKARVDQFKAPVGATPSQLIPDGTPLLFAPKWKGSLSADYRARTGAVDVWLGASSTFQSKQLSIFDADPVRRRVGTIPAYALFNASVGVSDPSDTYRITFQVRNLTDKAFFSHIEPGGPSGSYRYQITRDADRYYGITARLNFGGGR